MFDALIALLTKLHGDDDNVKTELADLEAAKTAYEAQRTADEATIADLQNRVTALGSPISTAAFALKTDLPDFTTFVLKSDLVALDGQIAGLSPAAVGAGAAITVDASGVPNTAVVGEAFSGNVVATGGSGPLNFQIDTGKLPDGLSMAAGGAISGAPGTVGTFTCDVEVSDANGDVGHATVAISVEEVVPEPEPAPEPVVEPQPEPQPEPVAET